ncbi:MAG: hypothetical protein QOJ53_4, partial [Sphingomonadales bacterium]|nr:hypothetical protein [Sphingomonadales bacterium]
MSSPMPGTGGSQPGGGALSGA